MANLSILFVEDDDSIRNIATTFLKRSGHEVTAAANVADALKFVAAQSFDVVVTDILLGSDRDGTDIIRAVRQKSPTTRIVAMSGGGDYLQPSYLLNMAVSFGALVPLMKPFTLSQLSAAIEGK